MVRLVSDSEPSLVDPYAVPGIEPIYHGQSSVVPVFHLPICHNLVSGSGDPTEYIVYVP